MISAGARCDIRHIITGHFGIAAGLRRAANPGPKPGK